MTNDNPLPVDDTLPGSSPDEYVEAMVKRAGTSFFWGMRRLEPNRRRAVFAVYAFCREVDDIADGHRSLHDKKSLLNAWRGEISTIFTGGACSHPIAMAIAPAVETYDLHDADFFAVIDGMEMDAQPQVRIMTSSELDLYCDRVACAVGRLCVRIFGLPDKEGIELANSLGMALQLTNILRDIAEDAVRDRVYLPADKLSVDTPECYSVQKALSAANLEQVCSEIAARAEDLYLTAERVAQSTDHAAARPAIMMMQVYWRVLRKLRRRGWRSIEKPVGLTKLEKVLVAIRYGLFS